MEQRTRLQSVSLDGLVIDPHSSQTHPAEDLIPPVRRNMETISFEDLQRLDFEESNILKHLTRDLRTAAASRGPLANGPAQQERLGNGPPANGLRGQPDLTMSLFPKRIVSESNISYDVLRDENGLLRQEVDALTKKCSKIPKLESEMEKINQSYQLLLSSAEKRESLENAMKLLLEREKQALRLENQQLRDQMRRDVPALMEEPRTEAIRNYEKLVGKNKELVENQKRQDIELAAQKSTLDEQRNHIRILDSALLNAQANVARLEEEVRKAQQNRSTLATGFQPAINSQRRPNSDESICRPGNWASNQKLSTDSLNVESRHSSTEKLRSVEELNFSHSRVRDIASPVKTTTVPRPDIAVAKSRNQVGNAICRIFCQPAARASIPNLTSFASCSDFNRPEDTRSEQGLLPTNHQRPRSAASVFRESRTEQWQV